MHFIYFISSLLTASYIFYFFFSPASPPPSDPFLTINNLWAASYLQGQKQSFLSARELSSEDSAFGLFRAKDVKFSLLEEGSISQGRMGSLSQDSITARTQMGEGVFIRQSEPPVSLQGESFVWDQNTLTLESQGELPISFLWKGGSLQGEYFLWDQSKQKFVLSKKVKGEIHDSP